MSRQYLENAHCFERFDEIDACITCIKMLARVFMPAVLGNIFFYAALDIYRSYILAADIFVFVVLDIYTHVSTDCGDLKSYSFKYCI